MTGRARIALTVASACVFAAVLGWGLAGLPDFGHYAGPYGDLISQLAPQQRHMANAVTATVFDYRGLDTMGEELILLAAASGTAMLLREVRETNVEDVVDRVRSDGLRATGAVAAVLVFVLGLAVVAHGFLTPGGGFQGGVVLAASVAIVFLGVEYRAFRRLASDPIAEPLEGVAAGLFVGFGLLALALGLAFLQNFLGNGTFGTLASSGSAALVNGAAGIAVGAAFLVVFGEYLQEAMGGRHRLRRGSSG